MPTKELGDLTRREFGTISFLGMALPSLVLPPESEAQQSRRHRFLRNKPLNLELIPETTINYQYSSRPSQEGQKLDLEEMAKGGIINPQFIGYSGQDSVKFEPDIDYANALIAEANDSTNNLFGFLNSIRLRKPEVRFKIPASASDVNPAAANNKAVTVYLFADMHYQATNIYKIKVNGKELVRDYPRDERVFGSELYHSLDASSNEPIYYNTSSPIASLVSAVPIEVLHRAMRKYTIANTKSDLEKARRKAGKVSEQEHNIIVYNNFSMEEKFVHALAALWLKQYNQKAKLGLTKEELDAQVSKYETIDRYRGTGKLAEIISGIGIRNAIDIYAKNPGVLFAAN